MIEAARFSRFYISILDNGYYVLITINSQINEIRMLQLSIKGILLFSKFHLVLICRFEPKMRTIDTKYVVCYSNN